MIRPDARVVLGVVVAVAAFALAATAVEDTDAWTHLALGRELVELARFPATERLLFPSGDLPYYNPEWLFGVALYLAYLASGFAGVVVLKAVVVALAFTVIYADALGPRGPAARSASAAVVALLTTAGALLMARHRFVERPDIALMLFLALTVYALNRYLEDGRARLLWLLPLVQVVWVNVHPSIVVGVVPFVAVLAGGAAQRLLERRFGTRVPGAPPAGALRTIAAVFVLVLLASLVNPYVWEPFVAPFRLVTATWLRHEVIELQPPDIRHFPGVAITSALLASTFLVRWRRPSLATLALIAPFVYLAWSARRFVFLLAVVAAPVLAREARAALARLPESWTRRLAVPAGALAALVALGPAALAVGEVRPLADPFRRPGFGVNLIGVPEGALAYLDRVGVEGNVFNIFHWGGYIAWRDYPRRRPFVDGRGYVPPGLLDDMMTIRRDAARLRQLVERYGFDAAIVDYPQGVMIDETPDVDLGLVSADWALVHWDDLALVYLRRTPALAAAIARDEYREVKPAMGVGFVRRGLGDPTRAKLIEAELLRNIRDTGSSTALAMLGFVENELGRHREAIVHLQRVQEFPLGSNLLNANLALAFAHTRLGDLPAAVDYYRRALALDEDPLTLHNTGLVLERIGKHRDAVRHFERALEKDPNLVPTYAALMRQAERAGHAARVAELQRGYAAAVERGQAEAHFKRGVKLYFEGKVSDAAAEFRQSVKRRPRGASAHSNLGFAYFDLGRLDEAFAEQRAALDIDPAFANAQYGLALIARARRDHAAASRHFERYLELEPRGYWARRAQAALTELTAR